MAGNTNYPTSLDSHTGGDPFGFAEVGNLIYTALTAALTAVATTVTVTSTAGFASRGIITIGLETITYTGKTATTFTGCTRGTGGTTAAAYGIGAIVGSAPVAANLNDHSAAIVALETQMGARLAYMPRTNRVINGDMRVKQRTTLGTTDDTYTLDRWNLLLEAASAAAASQETSDVPTDGSNRALKLTVGSGEDNKFGVVTFLEFADVADLRGKTISLQAKLKATAAITDVRMAVLSWDGTADSVTSDVVSSWGSAGTVPTLATNWAYLKLASADPANLSVTTSWATYRVEGLTVGASANNLAVFIWCEDESTTVTTDILRITDVQLEEGPTCSGFERRSVALERHLCRRYYRNLGTATIGVFSSATVWGFAVTFEQAMFTSPTASLLVSTMIVTEPGVAVRTGTSASYTGAAGSAIGWAGTISGTGFAGTVNAMAFAESQPFLSLNAEL